MDTHETKVYIAFLIAAGILCVFLIFFIATVISHQRRNQALHKEKINAEINTQEKERSRIASDLHDDLGPMLSAVKLLINNVDLSSSDDKQTLSKANDYIDGVLLQLRTISNDLVPQALGRKGLVVAVDEFVSELNEKRKMQVSFKSIEGLVVPPAQGIHLYRIIHEVIHNADKHAEATLMEVYLENKSDQLILTMKDNGRGFDTKDALTVQKGLGLKNIMSRVETLKGSLYLLSAPGKGTEYTIEIPMGQSI
jgi:signal transduction histidine kinase